MTKEELQQLRDISIFDILQVKNTGRKKNIVCPFHADKDPSMTLNPETNGFKCWGCGVQGYGAIDLLVAGGASFQEAVGELKLF